jgi:hypothetical protein
MAAAITTGHPTSNWRDEIQGLMPSSKHVGVTSGTDLWTIDVVKWFISDVLKVKWQSYRAFLTVKVNT